MTSKPVEEFKQRARRAVVTHAFFRLESAVTIALSILLAWFLPRPFAWWRGWYWLALGLVAEALIVLTSMTDEAASQSALGELLREEERPPRLQSPRYREKVQQALQYRARISQALLQMRAGVLRNYLLQSMDDLSDWVRLIFGLAERLDAYEHDEIIQRDGAAVASAIQELQRQVRAESDPSTRQQIEGVLQARIEQRQSLDKLQGLMEQAQFRLEESLTSLGTAYSQFQLIRAEKADSAAYDDLSRRMRGQVQELEDILQSMRQVYSASRGEPVKMEEKQP